MPVKILLVEDTPVLTKNIHDILVMENYEVLCAPNGKEGIKLALEHKPALIITDLVMPEVDGLSFIKSIRKFYDRDTLPIIIFSAKTDKLTVEEGILAGANSFLKKPCDVDTLVTTVQLNLAKSRQ
jgi:two-component system, sensor histidine kinase and response regulator